MEDDVASVLRLDSPPPEKLRRTGQASAKLAATLMAERDGFHIVTAKQKRVIAMAFAGVDKPVYGQAFDLVHITGAPLDLLDLAAVQARLADVTLYEVKSSDKNPPEDFSGYFFSVSTAELLVAQKLGSQFRFVFVDVNSGHHFELSLSEVFARAKGIYPAWSIQF